MLKEEGFYGRLEGGERGLQKQGKWEGVPVGWAVAQSDCDTQKINAKTLLVLGADCTHTGCQ
jgi:hypothetical protein